MKHLFGELDQNNSLATVALAFSDHSLVVGVKGLTWLADSPFLLAYTCTVEGWSSGASSAAAGSMPRTRECDNKRPAFLRSFGGNDSTHAHIVSQASLFTFWRTFYQSKSFFSYSYYSICIYSPQHLPLPDPRMIFFMKTIIMWYTTNCQERIAPENW